MNKCIFCGNLGKDIELTITASGVTVGKFSLAVQRMKKEEGADFLNMVCFSKTAETMGKYLNKGSKVLVETHVQTGSYTNKEGKKVYTTDFVVDRFEFVGGAKQNNDGQADEHLTKIEDGGDLPF